MEDDFVRIAGYIIGSIRISATNGRNKLSMHDKIFISQRIDACRIRLQHLQDRFVDGEEVVRETISDLLQVLESRAFDMLASHRFMMAGPKDVGGLVRSRIGETDNRLAIEYVLEGLRDLAVTKTLFPEDYGAASTNSSDENSAKLIKLKQIIPEQKISPVRFDFVDKILVVEHLPATSELGDKANVIAAKAALIEQGKAIVSGLKISNCDNRFIEAVEDLQLKITSSKDIIQLGIVNMSCEEMRERFSSELPDAVSAKLKAHLAAVSMYVAQFPEWVRFADNAAMVELSPEDIQQSQLVAEKLVDELSKFPDEVDEEVPRTIKAIIDTIRDPRRASKRAAFAVFRTLENLFIKVFGYASKFLDDLVTETSSRTSKWAGGALATLMVKAVLEGAGVLAPIYARLPDATWVRGAVDLIKQISI